MSNVKQMPIIREKRVRSRSSRKLLFLLFLFFITLLVILFLKSSISKVADIEIKGNVHSTIPQIEEAAGIEVGDQFLMIRTRTIEQNLAQLDMIHEVEVTRSFPGRIFIKVQEYPEVAFQMEPDGSRGVILSNGFEIALDDHEVIMDKPILTGWSLGDPMKAKLCKMLDLIPDELLADISEIKPDASDSYPDKIKLYTRSRFEVTSTITYFPDKVEYMRYIITEKEPGHITMLETNYHSLFEQDKILGTDLEEELSNE